MAMVRQLTGGELINGSTPEDDSHSSDHMECYNSRPPSRSSSGSKRNSPTYMPSLQYSKEDLMKYSTLPLSQNWPTCLDPAYNNPTGKWDPERWFMNHRSDRIMPVEEPRAKRERQDESIISHKRKSSDPKERIKEEKDDIVLSPQRRSFGTGCHVIQQSSLARRPGSPTDGRESENFRDPSRRIGSGRIMARDREQREWERDREYGYNTSRNERRDRFDQDESEKDLRRYSSRYNRGERRSRGRDRIDEVEPEWFSGGPTSQSETIELVGFEDVQNDDENRKPTKKSGKRAKQNSRRSSLKSEESERVEPPALEDNTSQKKSSFPQEESKSTAENKASDGEVQENNKSSNAGFDLDDLFRMDWIPGLLQNESPPDNVNKEMGCSRFSQWFRRDSPLPDLPESGNNSRRSSLHEELIANVLNIESSKSVKELEADLKRIVLGDKKQQEERSAFDKLLQHMSDSRNSPATSLSMGPLDKSKALQEQDLLQDILGGPQPTSVSPMLQPFQMFKEEKTGSQLSSGMPRSQYGHPNQQTQSEMFAHLMQQKQQEQQHLQHIQHQQQLQQQQMQNHIQQQAHQQSQNLNVQGFTVDMLAKILGTSSQSPISPNSAGLHQSASAPSLNRNDPQVLNFFSQQPPALSHAPAPIHPAALVQAMAQNAASSNTLQVQNPVVLQRVPSPQELAVHTQSILQNALIKRKLEEQKENFRKRQEAQRTSSPVTSNKNGMSISPLKGLSPTIAFTPTSVMRKIQSEKAENKELKIASQQNGNKLSGVGDSRPADSSQKISTVGISTANVDCSFGVVNSSHLPTSQNSSGLSQGARALHGQANTQPRSIHGSMNSVAPSLVIPGQGRPIVKVGIGQGINSTAELSRASIVTNKSGTHNKPFLTGNNQAHNIHHDVDPSFDAVAKFPWQHQLARQQNASSMPQLQMAAATYAALNHRPPALNPHHPSLLRPVNIASAGNVPAPNINFPLLRNTVQNPIRAQTNTISQLSHIGHLAALQLQRGTIDNRQLQALAQSQRFHPATLQQLIMNTQNQSLTAAQAQVVTGFPGNRDTKHQHLLPGQSSTNRQSPVNLAKWFGNDVLKQKMPEMPPVSHQKALLVEEVERQQQQSAVVHN